MRRLLTFCFLLSATAAFAQLKYDAAKLVYTSDAKGHSIDETGKLFDTLLRKSQPVVLFVHGRGDEPQKSLRGIGRRGNAVAKLATYGVAVVMYNWDSKAGDDGEGPDRQRPLDNMPEAQERFGTVLDKLGQTLVNLEREHITPPPITLLAHSMGTIVVQRYIEANGWRTPGGRRLFNAVILSSSDAAREDHRVWVDKLGAVEQVFITVNPVDVVLTVSETANPPNPHPLGKNPGSDRSPRATYRTIRSLNHEIFSRDKARPFFRAIFFAEELPQSGTSDSSSASRVTGSSRRSMSSTSPSRRSSSIS